MSNFPAAATVTSKCYFDELLQVIHRTNQAVRYLKLSEQDSTGESFDGPGQTGSRHVELSTTMGKPATMLERFDQGAAYIDGQLEDDDSHVRNKV